MIFPVFGGWMTAPAGGAIVAPIAMRSRADREAPGFAERSDDPQGLEKAGALFVGLEVLEAEHVDVGIRAHGEQFNGQGREQRVDRNLQGGPGEHRAGAHPALSSRPVL